MKTQDNKYVRIMVITIVLLIAVTAAYVLYIKNASDNVRVFDADSDEVSIEVFNPEGKIWEDMYRYPGHPCGAE